MVFLGDNDIPINTTLSNNHASVTPSRLEAMLIPDLITKQQANSQLRVVHTMPLRVDPLDSNVELPMFTEAHQRELERIRLLSFHPLCASIMTDEEKEFIWNCRYR